MLTYYKCIHFTIEELVSPAVYSKYGERAWQFLDPRLLVTIDALREKFGSCTINNWSWGGQLTESGLRSLDFGGVENRSLHKSGMAADLKFKNFPTEEVRAYILRNPSEFPYIKGVELGVSWVHIDVRNLLSVLKFTP